MYIVVENDAFSAMRMLTIFYRINHVFADIGEPCAANKVPFFGSCEVVLVYAGPVGIKCVHVG